ncbi:MAG: DUF1570 domain-containing protein [Thermoguttaceae bacterium]
MHSFLLIAVLLTAATPTVEVRSQHYQVLSSEPSAAETGRLLDQLHEQLDEFFGHCPEDPLRVNLLPDREAFHDALRRDGHPAVSGGGYYAPENRTIYLYTQPSVYYTRHLLLHEATHQFHFLVATGNRSLEAAWYLEGLAEYFAMHNWDGDRLRCGVVPAVTLEDYPATALKAIEGAGDRANWLRRVIEGQETLSRPVGWALVHFLVNRQRDAFRRLGARLDRREAPLKAFAETIGPVTAELADEFHRWVAAHQQPWSIVWIEWQQAGDRIEGSSRTVGLLVHKEPLARLELEVEPKDPVWKAGAVFGYRDVTDFYLVQLNSDRQVRVLQRIGSRWSVVSTARTADDANRLLVRCEGDRVRVSMGATPICDRVAPGKIGLHIDDCRVAFRTELTPEPAH